MRIVTEDEVIAINQLMIQRYSPAEPIGIKDLGLLNSSVQRMNHSAFGVDAYPSLFEKAAALFHSLSKNHRFLNANKRTAYATLQLLLTRNGYKLRLDETEAILFCVQTATESIEISQLAVQIERYCIKK